MRTVQERIENTVLKQANGAAILPLENAPCLSAQDPTPQSRVSTVLVRALAEMTQRRGISAEVLLGVDLGALYAEPVERRFSRAWFQQLFQRAIQLTGDPALGLHYGSQASAASFGVIAPLVSHAPNLRRACELLVQFQPMIVDGVRIKLTERMGVAQLHCEIDCQDSEDTVDRSFVELIMAGLVRTLQAFGCMPNDIRAVCFQHARPAHHHAYSEAFFRAERFLQPYTSVEFTASALDRPHLHHNPELHRLVLTQAEDKLSGLTRPISCTERVRVLMNGRRAARLPSMNAVSRALGLSVRSLRRHLEDENTSYRELAQAMLHEEACSMLRNANVPLQSVAHDLGFANATAFHRAFRRWSTLTPAEYRAAFMGKRNSQAHGNAKTNPDAALVSGRSSV
jgi:AraC-like DNA-binding protein